METTLTRKAGNAPGLLAGARPEARAHKPAGPAAAARGASLARLRIETRRRAAELIAVLRSLD